MKIIVFCGPTIAVDEASRILPADFRPPVKHGDLISCVYSDRPDVIVVIDGAAMDNLAVWHNEINDALNQGVTVYGCSAMGAIRAVEMKPWGMRGVGEVYKLIADGTIEADDEVLCDYSVTDEGMYRKKTMTVVNLRYILAEAVVASILNQSTADEFLKTAQAMFYQDRTISNMITSCLEKGILTHEESQVLYGFISHCPTDIQKLDAMACLETVRELRLEDLEKTEKNYEYDLFFEALYERDRGTKHDNGYHPFYKIANDYAVYASDIESVNDAALNRKICALIADHFNMDVADDEIAAEKKLFVQKNRLKDQDHYHAWLKNNDLTEQELNALLAERVKVNKLQNWYRTRLGFAKNTRYLLEELKLNNRYVEWKQKSIELHETLKNNQKDVTRTFNENDINTLAAAFLKRNSRPWKHAPFHFIKKIGMDSNAFKNLLARDKTLSDMVAMEFYDQV